VHDMKLRNCVIRMILVEKDEMDRKCGTDVVNKDCIQHFGPKTFVEDLRIDGR
jgi:hypothetical protein